MLGEELTRWTIRLALTCYVAYLAGWLVWPTRGKLFAPWPLIARWIWTIGCLLFVVHVACAFHFYHNWSHAAAFEKTAAETEQLLGVRFGEGIYFSYLFTLLWVADVAWSWLRPSSMAPNTNRLQITLHAYLFFIAFNGAIVFESGPTRWAGIAACLFLASLVARAAYTSSVEFGLRSAE